MNIELIRLKTLVPTEMGIHSGRVRQMESQDRTGLHLGLHGCRSPGSREGGEGRR